MSRILCVLWFLIGCQVSAENCGPRAISLYFANGMFNTEDAANQSRAKLELAAHHPVTLAYNLNETAILELIQVAEQKEEELARIFWQNLANEFPLEPGSNPGKIRGAFDSIWPALLEISKTYDRDRYLRDADLQKHVQMYRADLQEGKHISVVAHSQGNFYANSAGELIANEAKGRYVVMGVAVPSSRMFEDGPYVTSAEDKVMAAVRMAKGALPANVKNLNPSPSGHEFGSQYVDGRGVEDLFANELQSVLWDDTSKSIYEPSFVDDSLRPFWRYVLNVLTDPPRVLEPQECLAILSFAKIYRR